MASRRRAAVALAVSAMAGAAQAQPAAVNPIWNGDWQLAQSNHRRAPVAFQVRTEGGVTRMHMANAACELAYDGTVTQQAILEKLQALKDWQLRPDHWPVGTDTSQLIGLQKEFDDAAQIIRTLPADLYRRVRAHCPQADPADDEFQVLNEGRRLFMLRFPANALGVGVTLYQRLR